MKTKTLEGLVDKHYEAMFEWIATNYGDELHDLVIEVKFSNDGKTIRRSWLDRDSMLLDEEKRNA